MEREAFLTRARAATGRRAVPSHGAYEPGPVVPDLGRPDLVEVFTTRLEEIDGHVQRVESHDDAVAAVIAILGGYGAASFLSWDDEHLPAPGVVPGLEAAGLARITADVPGEAAARIAHQMGYFDLVAGITGAEAGLAESGSLVLSTGPGRPRMASLIPLVHVALLRVADIVASLSHWVAAHPEAAAGTSNLVIVSGPSRTADIEMQLNLGVHGPKHVHVVLIG